ncbi:glycerate kinase [Carboxydocella sporoproducens DSM 16521]|uniref:Glycerate kinase n=2 Tax=Carboxydocella TaxID=178898 RepID=A0A1T4LZW8_9FIRM|nr:MULTISPECIES: glycerate kinase [Carboxydocella]AVX21112.1 glycerate kinase [Carboxydocella thermautotrophica]SJZ60273.1 glycerate kinase [Carboxydocella sporoproducens DSM 16521]
MRVLIVPDSFKGSLSATAVAEAIRSGWQRVRPQDEIKLIPIADGGEGTVEALLTAVGGEKVDCVVRGPLDRPVQAFYGLLNEGRTAVIEMAAASGLHLVPVAERNPLLTTTSGTGQLIKAALDRGCRRLIIGIGGSATNDGGTGMATALGARFLDQEGRELPPGGGALVNLWQVDLSGLDPRIKEVEILVACDVTNPLIGPQGASRIYGPQKGATAEQVEILEAGLTRLAKVVEGELGVAIADLPGAGAAGGLGGGLVAFLGARLQPGFPLIARQCRLQEWIDWAELVITGEGQLDGQSVYGKVPVGVAAMAKGKPVIVLAGSIGPGAEKTLTAGITAYFSIVSGPMALAEAMERGRELLVETAEQVARILTIKKAGNG